MNRSASDASRPHRLARCWWGLGAGLALLAAGLCPAALAQSGAMRSPWWENYEIRESFLCRDTNRIVLERNDAQVSVIGGNTRTTLFRETSSLPGIRYGNDALRLIIRGDELTIERLPQRIQCLRTDQA